MKSRVSFCLLFLSLLIFFGVCVFVFVGRDPVKELGVVREKDTSWHFTGVRFGNLDCVAVTWVEDVPHDGHGPSGHSSRPARMMFTCSQ